MYLQPQSGDDARQGLRLTRCSPFSGNTCTAQLAESHLKWMLEDISCFCPTIMEISQAAEKHFHAFALIPKGGSNHLRQCEQTRRSGFRLRSFHKISPSNLSGEAEHRHTATCSRVANARPCTVPPRLVFFFLSLTSIPPLSVKQEIMAARHK